MKTKTVASSIVAVIVSCACLFMFVPAATAAEGVTVTSTKSFPSYTQVRKDLTTEATATSVEDNADWGGIENLDVPQPTPRTVMSLALLLLIPMPVVWFPLVPVSLSTVRIL